MITFIPAWSEEIKSDFFKDDMKNQIRSFMLSDDKENQKQTYQVWIADYIPGLRYFLHKFELLESNYVSLFDELQGFTSKRQQAVNLEDLPFPIDASYVYTPFRIIVYAAGQNGSNGPKIGEIQQGESAQISRVTYMTDKAKIERIDIYDDRGFVSSQHVYDENGTFQRIDYLDFEARVIFSSDVSGKISVNPENTHGLKETSYPSMEALKFELIEKKCIEFKNAFGDSEKNHIFIAAKHENAYYLINSQVLDYLDPSFFEYRGGFSKASHHLLVQLADKAENLFVDSRKNFEELREILETEGTEVQEENQEENQEKNREENQEELPSEKRNNDAKIYQLSPYDSVFDLSISQELRDEIIYIDITRTPREEIEQRFINFVSYIYTESNRTFKIYYRVKDKADEEYFSRKFLDILRQMFPNAMEEVDGLIQHEDPGENLIGIEEEEKVSPDVTFIKNLRKNINCEVITDESRLIEIVHQARLIIDLSSAPDQYTQILGISSGIPQINAVATEYIEHMKNGWILRDSQDLYQALDYYLDSLKHWQDARMHSVQKIKQYSGLALREEILRIIEGKKEVKESERR